MALTSINVNDSTITNVDERPQFGSKNLVESGGIIDLLYDYMNPYLKFNNDDFYLSYENYPSIDKNAGKLKMIFRLPDNVNDIIPNKLLVHYEDSLMIAIVNGYLRIYNYSWLGGDNFTVNMTNYVGELIELIVEKHYVQTFYTENCTVPGLLKKDGSVSTEWGTENYATSDFISLENIYRIDYYNLFSEGSYDTGPIGMLIYDSSKNIIDKRGDLTGTYIVGSNAAYIRFSPLDKRQNNAAVYCFDRNSTNNVFLKISVNKESATAIVTPDPTGTSNDVFVACNAMSPTYTGQKIYIDFYSLTYYDVFDNMVWTINANTVPQNYVSVTKVMPLLNNDLNYISDYLSVLPSKIFITSNKEYNIYMDNVVLGYSDKGLKLNITTSYYVGSIRCMDRCVRLNISTVGQHLTTWNLYNSDGILIETKDIIIVVSNPNAGSGNKTFLFVGDSTIDNAIAQTFEGAIIVSEFHTLMSQTYSGTQPLLIGKRVYPEGTATGGYRHEGYAGMSSSYFVGSSSPFYYNGSINFSSYYQNVKSKTPGATSQIDYMIYQIGINDLKSSAGVPLSVIDNIKSLIDSFLLAFPNSKVIIGMICTGNDMDGFSAHFNGTVTLLSEYVLFRKRMLLLYKLIVQVFDNNKYSNKVFVCNSGQMIDRIYGYPYEMLPVSSRNEETIMVHTDSVHPNVSGYKQMADAYFGLVKYLES